jgi:hypothetical protein
VNDALNVLRADVQHHKEKNAHKWKAVVYNKAQSVRVRIKLYTLRSPRGFEVLEIQRMSGDLLTFNSCVYQPLVTRLVCTGAVRSLFSNVVVSKVTDHLRGLSVEGVSFPNVDLLVSLASLSYNSMLEPAADVVRTMSRLIRDHRPTDLKELRNEGGTLMRCAVTVLANSLTPDTAKWVDQDTKKVLVGLFVHKDSHYSTNELRAQVFWLVTRMGWGRDLRIFRNPE